MPKVKVNQSRLSSIDNDFQQAIRQLGMVTNQFQAVASNIDWDIKAKSNVNRRLTRLSRELRDELNALQGFARFTQEAQRRYDQTEREISQRIGHIGDSDQGSTYSGVGKAVPNQPGLRRPQQVGGVFSQGVSFENVKALLGNVVPIVFPLQWAVINSPGDILSLFDGIDDQTEAGFWKNFTSEFTKYFPKKNAKPVSKIKVAGKYGGLVVSTLLSAFNNISEGKSKGYNDTRIAGETLIETGVGLVTGALLTAGITAVLGAGAPVVAVGAMSVAASVAINKTVEFLTGGRDIGELASDLILGDDQERKQVVEDIKKTGQNIVKFGGETVKNISKAAQDLGNKVADGWNAVTKWGSSLFGFG